MRTQGTRFELDGETFTFVGANVGVVHGMPHRAALESVLDAVKSDGLRVIRVWALGERAEDAPDWARDFAFRMGERGWVATSFEHLDQVLVSAHERGLKVILVLANRWRDYGGFPQYFRWAGIPFDQSVPYPLNELELARFWTCERCDALYREHVQHVVMRTNSRTGLAYRDDPTIMAYELVNESSAPSRARALLTSWTDRMARFIRSMDSNHLIAAGHIGYERAHQRETWLDLQRLSSIDYCDAHAYPAAYDRVRTLGELQAYVEDRVALARQVGKPFVWGEFGFRDRDALAHGGSRASWYRNFLRFSHRAGASGALVWTYLPFERRHADYGIHPEGPPSLRGRDVRDVLRRESARWARIPPEMQRSDELAESLYPRFRTVRGTSQIHSEWRGGELRIPIAEFTRARFEAVGRFGEGEARHLWGEGQGNVRYRFRAPDQRPPLALEIALRASSELPGSGQGATEEDGARIEVRVDDTAIGVFDVPPDDGVGTLVVLRMTDREQLAALFPRRGELSRRAEHVLELAVVEGYGAEGLCLYGSDLRVRWTGSQPLFE